MKNKHEDYCCVCGEVVLEGAGIAEQRLRNLSDAGWGKTKWVVRHAQCTETPPSVQGDANKLNNTINGNRN